MLMSCFTVLTTVKIYSIGQNRNRSFVDFKPNVDVLFHCIDDCQDIIQFRTEQNLICRPNVDVLFHCIDY